MRPLLLPALALLLLSACAVHGNRQEVLAVLETQQQAWNRGDLTAFVEAGYWRSPELTFFSGGDVTKGYDGLIDRYEARYASEGAEMGRLTFSELEPFVVAPDLAFVRGRWLLEFEPADDRKDTDDGSGTGESLGGLFTLVLRQTKDGWRIVHDHTSVREPAE